MCHIPSIILGIFSNPLKGVDSEPVELSFNAIVLSSSVFISIERLIGAFKFEIHLKKVWII